MKKVFVSAPFSGKTEAEVFESLFECANKYMEIHGTGEDVAFVENYHITAMDKQKAEKCRIPRLYYLGLALQRMAECDDVIFDPEWEKARGCKVEHLAYELYFKDGDS